MWFLLLSACEPTSAPPEAWQGGTFSVITTSVTDVSCDVGLDSLFMPDGAATEWSASIEVPGLDDLTYDYSFDLVDPFGTVNVSMTLGEQGGETMQALGMEESGVLIDPVSWPDCTVDLSADLYLQIVEDNELTGSLILRLDGWADATCPAVGGDPCDVKLDLRLQRD